ncbi:MAG: hypothetical protein K2O87_04865 [Duncaniella freteri]|nr:hypothetical protein [Duncaniella freteri]
MTENEINTEQEIKSGQTYHRIGIFQNQFSKVLLDGVSRIGLPDVRVISTTKEIEENECDIIILANDDTLMWKEVYEMCEYLNIPVMFTFNFGIGACITITEPRGVKPDFIFNNRGEEPWKWMLDYARGHNAFFNVTNHRWLDSAESWLENPSVKHSIGIYAQTIAAIHMLTAMAHGTEVNRYPRFYLLSMVNQH